MTHSIQEQQGSQMISGVLVVIALVCLLELTWLIFNTSILWSVVVGWGVVALFPFVIRVASMWLLPSGQRVLRQ